VSEKRVGEVVLQAYVSSYSTQSYNVCLQSARFHWPIIV